MSLYCAEKESKEIEFQDEQKKTSRCMCNWRSFGAKSSAAGFVCYHWIYATNVNERFCKHLREIE
jgi:hypothetical protein